uniref:Uncharacterized protein n=1 Tax=Opuntia streptacantha TaxID=393608 RepID=A0A7C9AVN7_OPUST
MPNGFFSLIASRKSSWASSMRPEWLQAVNAASNVIKSALMLYFCTSLKTWIASLPQPSIRCPAMSAFHETESLAGNSANISFDSARHPHLQYIEIIEFPRPTLENNPDLMTREWIAPP